MIVTRVFILLNSYLVDFTLQESNQRDQRQVLLTLLVGDRSTGEFGDWGSEVDLSSACCFFKWKSSKLCRLASSSPSLSVSLYFLDLTDVVSSSAMLAKIP